LLCQQEHLLRCLLVDIGKIGIQSAAGQKLHVQGFSAKILRNMRTFYEEWITLDHMYDEELSLADASAIIVSTNA